VSHAADRSEISRALASSRWRKSSRSTAQGCCLEVLIEASIVFLRDSKYLRDTSNRAELQPVIVVAGNDWEHFTGRLARGEAEPLGSALTVETTSGAVVLTCTSSLVSLQFTHDEWNAFLDGVSAEEFVLTSF
jgi:Domain of unknown function (DUF397)